MAGEKEGPGTTMEERLMCRSTGALQVLHLGTCYSLRGYPGRRILYARGGCSSTAPDVYV